MKASGFSRIWPAAVCAALCVLLPSALAFAGGKSEATTINLYSSGSDNVRLTWEAVLAEFKTVHPDITVNLQFLSSGTGGQTGVDRLIAAVKAGQKTTDIDILETSDNDIARIFAEAGKEALVTIDAKQVPNSAGAIQKSSVGGDRSVAFRGTTVLLAYDSAKVAVPPKTAAELYAWIKANPGRFAYNDPTTGGAGSSFVVTAVYNPLPPEALRSIEATWKSKWDEGFNLLTDLHPYFYKASGKVQYPAKNQGTLDLLATGEVWMIPAWADMVLDQKSRGLLPQTVKLTQIAPAFTGGIQTLVVPALSQKKEAAYKLLDFVTSAKGQQIFVEKQKAIPVIDGSKLSKETVALLSGLEIKGFRSYTIGKLSDDIMRRWQETIATLK